jgi:GTP cyclohydrolase I
MLLLSAVTLAGSIVVLVLASHCCSMFRDVREAQEELRHQIQQLYHAALSAKGLGHDETIRGLYRHGQPFRRILEEITD